MNIECPSCSVDNHIEFGDNVLCSDCHNPFSGHSYKKFKKPLISATTALIIGAYGGYKTDQLFFEDSRYPLGVEYELIDSCVNSSASSMSSLRLVQKKEVCICATESTVKEIEYKKISENETEFLSRFRTSIAECL